MGIQHVLARAAQDERFRDDLIERRSAAARDAGFILSRSETTILDSVTSDMLGQMIGELAGIVANGAASQRPTPDLDVLPPEVFEPCGGVRPDLPEELGVVTEPSSKVRNPTGCVPWALGGLALALGGMGVLALTVTTGIRDDVPPEVVRPPLEAGPAATSSDAGAHDAPDGDRTADGDEEAD